MSFLGDSHVVVTTSKMEDYELRLRFRTTLRDGLLALGQGNTYFRLEISNGSLNLQSSLLNKWGGIYTGSNLNTGEWQSVALKINGTAIALSCGEDESCLTHHELEPSSTNNTFPITVVGGYTPNLKVVARNLSFTGCMEDIVVNDVWVVADYSDSMFFNIVEGCPREEQCQPNLCKNEGVCNDMWTTFICECRRPYLGADCSYSYNPATFGYENTSVSLAISEIPSELRPRLSEYVDISLFVRTRQEQGVIFYVGSTQGSRHDLSWLDSSSYIVLELRNGKLGVRVMLADTEQRFLVDRLAVNDGEYRLVRVLRDHSNLTVFVNDTVYLEGEIESTRKLNAEILALGGLPRELEHSNRRRKRTTSGLGYFKGTLLDIRLADGVEERNIEIFPLDNNILRSATIPTIETVGLVIGSPSDDTCKSNPCENNATCSVTWNDFACECTKGFRGKTCSQLQYCELFQCPDEGVCVNQDEGYDCVSNITLTRSQITYRAQLDAEARLSNELSLTFRTQQGGGILYFWQDEVFLGVTLSNSSIVIRSNFGGTKQETVVQVGNITDGEWHSAVITFTETAVECQVDGVGSSVPTDRTLVNTSQLIVGEIHLGASDQPYEGCVGEVRIGGVLMPFFTSDLLLNNSSPVQLVMTGSTDIQRDCILCRDVYCRHDSVCIDPSASYDCLCPPGYQGQHCQYDIDECLDNFCSVGSTCVDGIANYTCSCPPGYKGWLCDEEVDECLSSPCLHDGICVDLVANYSCNCSQEFKGNDCEYRKICADDPCPEGVTCQDKIDPVTKESLDFVCECPYGYTGRFCSDIFDFCEDNPCLNNALCVSFPLSGYECECLPGFRGNNCNINIDECESQPCQNGGTCNDLDNAYNCTCPSGFEGDHCEKDIDECTVQNQCHNGGTCINEIASFICECPENYCGKTCLLENTCIVGHECKNEGVCRPICNELTFEVGYACECTEDYTGTFCTELAGPAFLDSPPIALIVGPLVGAMLLIGLVGLITFVMMARKKRATRGTYSPSRQEMYGSRVEMGNVMKPPPEERLI